MATSIHVLAAIRQPAAESTYGVSRRSNARPAWASSMRKITCVPKYGAGLGLRTVAWISCKSSVGADADTFAATDSVTDDMVVSSRSYRAVKAPALTFAEGEAPSVAPSSGVTGYGSTSSALAGSVCGW